MRIKFSLQILPLSRAKTRMINTFPPTHHPNFPTTLRDPVRHLLFFAVRPFPIQRPSSSALFNHAEWHGRLVGGLNRKPLLHFEYMRKLYEVRTAECRIPRRVLGPNNGNENPIQIPSIPPPFPEPFSFSYPVCMESTYATLFPAAKKGDMRHLITCTWM